MNVLIKRPVQSALGLVASVVLMGTFAVAQDQPPVAAGLREYVGINGCIKCHTAPPAIGDFGIPAELLKKDKANQWILYTELPVWGRKDKHKQAYAVLFNDRSKQMGKILGIDEIHRDTRCLACHTGYPLADMQPDQKGMCSQEVSQKSDVILGVTCEGCHGSSGDRGGAKGWLTPHTMETPKSTTAEQAANVWRYLSCQEKHEKFGYEDLRTPSARARACLSCHLGNAEDGRIVTHEMYAAGHPPLPGFEVETFVQQTPRHWRTITEKGEEIRNNFLALTREPQFAKESFQVDQLHNTKAVLVGAMITLSESVKLTSDLAEGKTTDLLSVKPEWPELAQFDCYACHHELKDRGWRQLRTGRVGAPGRPPMREWPIALAQIAARALGQDAAAFKMKFEGVQAASVARPFGDRDSLISQSQDVVTWANSLASELEKKAFTKEFGEQIRSHICDLASTMTVDYDSARQLVWSFIVVDQELSGKSLHIDSILKQPPEEVGKMLSAYAPESATGKLLQSIDTDMFLLNLRSGRNIAQKLPNLQSDFNLLQVDLNESLPFIENYEPETFKARFKEIAKSLGK